MKLLSWIIWIKKYGIREYKKQFPTNFSIHSKRCKSLYVVSSKCLKHTQIATKYEKDILKIKLETAAISKEIVMTELEIAKQKLTTEQYILWITETKRKYDIKYKSILILFIAVYYIFH